MTILLLPGTVFGDKLFAVEAAATGGVLLLLVSQLNFLIPPMGYAVLMARSQSGLGQVSAITLLKALWPFQLAQLTVTAAVFIAPALVHQFDTAIASKTDNLPVSEQDIEKMMENMSNTANKYKAEP
jgi:hypothetical protein